MKKSNLNYCPTEPCEYTGNMPCDSVGYCPYGIGVSNCNGTPKKTNNKMHVLMIYTESEGFCDILENEYKIKIMPNVKSAIAEYVGRGFCGYHVLLSIDGVMYDNNIRKYNPSWIRCYERFNGYESSQKALGHNIDNIDILDILGRDTELNIGGLI